jgi:uncharacterized protein YbjT (DUF2867 family)
MILVTGATGLVGGELVAKLHARGVEVLALSRNPGTAKLPDGVEVVSGDLSAPASLEHILSRVDRVYLSAGGRMSDALAATLSRGGVKRVVVVSGLDSPPDDVERPLRASGMEWTSLRPSAFAANSSDMWGPSIRATQSVRTPYPEAVTASIHESDIADVAATVLLDDGDGHHEKRYELTGPQALSLRRQVETIAEVTRRDIALIEETPEEARERLLTISGHKAFVDRILQRWLDASQNPPSPTTNVEIITGHPARSFAQWVRDHVHDFQ